MGCQLDCPGCIPIKARRQRVAPTSHGHLTLASHVVDKIITDLHRAGVAIRKFDFQGHGEPLLNVRTWEMARRVADLYPGAVVSICTNAATAWPQSSPSAANSRSASASSAAAS